MLTHNLFSGLYSDVGEYLRDEVSSLYIPSMPPLCGGIGDWESGPTDVYFVTFAGDPILKRIME